MPSRLFRVDLSDGSRDFAPVATEPGLAMLDAQAVNYHILFKWLGSYVAEPERQGPDLVAFYVREEERGRLENVTCAPATKRDLQGPLKGDLEEIEAGIRKAKPETATEQLLHKIVAKSFKDLTVDLDASDHSCHFFKYRAGAEPWRLVFCWGYQRRDMEPSQGVVCSNPDCHQLFAHRPKTKKRCPACSTIPAKKGAGALLAPRYLILLLLLLLGLFLFFNQPKLVVTPGTWQGQRGSRIDFQVVHQRWFFLRDDISDRAVAQSHDTSIIEFQHGTTAKAKAQGNAYVTFRYGSLHNDATVNIGPPVPPEMLTIEPEEVKLAVDSTARIKVIGHYKDESTLDLTEEANLTIKDKNIAYASAGRLHGVAAGTTIVTATYQATEKDKPQDVTGKVEVTEIQYASLDVSIDTDPLAVGQTGQLQIVGVTAEGDRYDLIGSKKLDIAIEPKDAVTRDDEYLTGKTTGAAKITAKWQDLAGSVEFNVGDSLLADGTFSVLPRDIVMSAGSYRELDVVGASSAPIESVSSDPNIVDVMTTDPITLTAYQPGSATITLTQGAAEQIVNVEVLPSNIVSVRIDPATINAYVGESTFVGVFGVTNSGAEVPIARDQLEILQQPRANYALFDRNDMTISGVHPTPKNIDEKLVIKFRALNEPATATVRVTRRLQTDIMEDFVAHPPIHVPATTVVAGPPVAIAGGTMIGDGLYYKPGVGLVVGETLPPGLVGTGIQPGAVIGSIGGVDIRDIRDPSLLTRYIQGLGAGGMIGVVGPGGVVADYKLGLVARQDVRLVDVKPESLSATDFNAVLTLFLREAGEYRVIDVDDNELSGWQTLGPNQTATITTSKIPRNADDDYDVYVQRKIGDSVREYQLPFNLKRENQ